MFVGGEFYEDFAWEMNSPAPPIEDSFFLNGGRACLSVISDYLYANHINKVLLPAYLCPSILDVLDQHAIGYSFYRINQDLSIDLEDLQVKAENAQAIYFINYFGFHHSPAVQELLSQFQSSGKLLIEDNAQAGFPTRRIGDFCFNSIRKYCGLDGGYLATRSNLRPIIENSRGLTNHRLPLIREYRRQLRSYLFEGHGSYEALNALFYEAEHFYEQDGVILGDADEEAKIERLDWQAIKSVRRAHYDYLLCQIKSLQFIQPIFPALQADIMPVGLPVYITGLPRERLVDLLAEESISLTVHWDALLSDPRTQKDPQPLEMATKILTLPVDQYANRSQLDYLLDHLDQAIKQLT